MQLCSSPQTSDESWVFEGTFLWPAGACLLLHRWLRHCVEQFPHDGAQIKFLHPSILSMPIYSFGLSRTSGLSLESGLAAKFGGSVVQTVEVVLLSKKL